MASISLRYSLPKLQIDQSDLFYLGKSPFDISIFGFLGKNYMDKFHLWPLSKGFSDVYLDTIDPRVTNEFAAAAFRFGHSLIPHTFQTGT